MALSIAWLLIAIVALLAVAQAAPAVWSQTLLAGAVVAAAGLWVFYLLLGRETYVVFSTVGAPVLVLMTYGIVRYTTCEIEAIARPHMLNVTAAALLFLTTMNFIRQRRYTVAMVWVLAGIGTLLTGVAFWQVLGEPRAALWGPATTARGLARAWFPEPADLAVYLHIVFSMTGAFMLFSRRSTNEKILFALATVVTVAGLALTQTPRYWAGWLASAVVLGLFLLRKRGWKPRWSLLGGSMALLLFFGGFLAMSQLRMASGKTTLLGLAGEVSPASGTGWQQVLAIGHRHVLGGTGPGMATWLYPSLRGNEPATALANEYLGVFAEFGVLGVLLVGWFVVTLALAIFHVQHLRAGRFSAATASNRFAFAVGGVAVLAAMLVDGGVGCSVRAPVNWMTLAVLLAAVLTCGLYHHSDPEDKPPKLGYYSLMRLKGLPRYVLTGGLVVVVLLYSSRLFQTIPAAYFAQEAVKHRAALRLDAAQLAAKRAVKLDHRSYAHAAALGDVLALQATWNPGDRRDLATEALRWYERALTLNPYHTDLLIQKARLHQMLEQETEAAACFRQASLTDPRNPAYLIAEGLFHQSQREFNRAQSCFQRAHALDPRNPLPVHQLYRLAELTGPAPSDPPASPVAD